MKIYKSILLLALVFLAGVAVGVVGTRAVVRHIVSEAIVHPEKIQAVIEHRLTRKLRLDNEQQVKLHAILSDTRGQLQDLRRQYRPELSEILTNTSGQISAMLTPEQQTQFEKIKRRNRALWQAAEQRP
jgi:Spy/CpxP family protein refolding chaperone